MDVNFLNRVDNRVIGAHVVANVILRQNVRHTVYELLIVSVTRPADVWRGRAAKIAYRGSQQCKVERIAAIIRQVEDKARGNGVRQV